MSSHRFQLERWETGKDSGSNKHICPACGRRTFVRYIDTETGEYLADDVGKCDRISHCGYHFPPRTFFLHHPERKGVCQVSASNSGSTKTCGKREMPSGPFTIPGKFLEPTLCQTSNLKEYLLDRLPEKAREIEDVWREYRVGGMDDGRVIYWQIDREQGVRTGKMMQYGRLTGHRVKTGNAVGWVHRSLIRQGLLPEGWRLSQALFGAHLLPARPEDTVCLVESEKTALICSVLMRNCLWLATGGIENLRVEPCRCLEGREVIIFPDLGAYDLWKVKAAGVAGQVNFSYSISDALEQSATDEEREAGLDIADYLLKET